MITQVSISSRGGVTLPIEIYSGDRIREFDEAEAELEAEMRTPGDSTDA